MNIYTNNSFEGYYPVGTAAVVIAETAEEAAEILEGELESRGMDQQINPKTMIKLDASSQDVVILNDGNY
jgi:hypothetical protein